MFDERNFNRFESEKSKIRRVSQNHRENYQNFSISNIFFSKENTQFNSENFDEKKQRTDLFVPKFTEKSAHQRKFIEFYNFDNSTYDTNVNTSSSEITPLSHVRKSSAVDLEVKSDYFTLNHKEKRIREMHPNLNKEEIEKYTKQEMDLKKEDRKNDSQLLNPKKAAISEMYSNIFNDPKKDQNTYVNQINDLNKKKKNSYKPHINVAKSNDMTKFEWLETNSELMFKENLKTEVESPKKMKIKQLCHLNNIDGKDLSVNMNYKTESSRNNNSVEAMTEVKKMLQEKFGSNHKYYKAIENIGRFHRDEFYNTLKIDKFDREVNSYEVENVPNFEKFNLNHIKKMFSNSGIHIYDIKLDGNNNSGKLGFKLRKNEDIKDFENRKNEVFKIMNDMGLQMKEAQTSTRRPLTSSLPSNVKWTNPQIEKFTKNNKNFDTVVIQSKKIPDSEKISKIFPEVNMQYKNMIVNERKIYQNTPSSKTMKK